MIRRIEVPVDHPAPGGTTNTYVLGDERVVVDPAAGLETLGLEPEGVSHVVLTHTHPDHYGGLGSVKAASGATVWALATHRRRFCDRTGIDPDRTFRPDEDLGPSGVSAMYCPGHAPDHVVLLFDGAAVVGDLARANGSVMVGTPDGDMRAYLTSLRRLRHRDVETAYPGHGPPIENPATRFDASIAHRLDRERRVRQAVQNGARRLDSIVEAAYDKDLTGLEAAARRTVIAHLRKLAVEGRVAWDGRTATIPP